MKNEEYSWTSPINLKYEQWTKLSSKGFPGFESLNIGNGRCIRTVGHLWNEPPIREPGRRVNFRNRLQSAVPNSFILLNIGVSVQWRMRNPRLNFIILYLSLGFFEVISEETFVPIFFSFCTNVIIPDN